jgi:hypothetical protein
MDRPPPFVGQDILVMIAALTLIGRFLDRHEIVGAMTVDHYMHLHVRGLA